MKKEIYTCYSAEADITFIMEEITDKNDDLISQRVKGFYYGKPEEENTKLFYGSLTMTFDFG